MRRRSGGGSPGKRERDGRTDTDVPKDRRREGRRRDGQDTGQAEGSRTRERRGKGSGAKQDGGPDKQTRPHTRMHTSPTGPGEHPPPTPTGPQSSIMANCSVAISWVTLGYFVAAFGALPKSSAGPNCGIPGLRALSAGGPSQGCGNAGPEAVLAPAALLLALVAALGLAAPAALALLAALPAAALLRRGKNCVRLGGRGVGTLGPGKNRNEWGGQEVRPTRAQDKFLLLTQHY